MDINAIVEQVTRQVVEGMKSPGSAGAVLVLYLEDTRSFWDVLEQVGGAPSVVLPRYAQEVFPVERLGVPYCFDHECAAGDRLNMADAVVVPSIPRSAELQLSSDRPAKGTLGLLKEALRRGKAVYVAEAKADQAKRLQDLGFRIGLPARKSTQVTLAGPGAKLAPMIDHTLLKADATEAEVEKLCAEARQYGFCSVCVNPTNVALASRFLNGCPVKVCTVIGFPLGATTPEVKAAEARDAIRHGANEIDMVINIGALKSKNYPLVKDDIRAVVMACRQGGALCKVILETALLTFEEKVAGCALSKEAGADFVKTSTGFSKGGATVEDIALMRKTVGPEMGVKASGGVRDLAGALAMVEAGATRIGASSSIEIVTGKKGSSSY